MPNFNLLTQNQKTQCLKSLEPIKNTNLYISTHNDKDNDGIKTYVISIWKYIEENIYNSTNNNFRLKNKNKFLRKLNYIDYQDDNYTDNNVGYLNNQLSIAELVGNYFDNKFEINLKIYKHIYHVYPNIKNKCFEQDGIIYLYNEPSKVIIEEKSEDKRKKKKQGPESTSQILGKIQSGSVISYSNMKEWEKLFK